MWHRKRNPVINRYAHTRTDDDEKHNDNKDEEEEEEEEGSSTTTTTTKTKQHNVKKVKFSCPHNQGTQDEPEFLNTTLNKRRTQTALPPVPLEEWLIVRQDRSEGFGEKKILFPVPDSNPDLKLNSLVFFPSYNLRSVRMDWIELAQWSSCEWSKERSSYREKLRIPWPLPLPAAYQE